MGRGTKALAEMAKKQGRPKGRITFLRAMAIHHHKITTGSGEEPSLAAVARFCGLHDYREARRVLNDLKEMGLI